MTLLHRHRWLTPYLLLAPGLAFLALFFLVPLYYLADTSLQKGTVQTGYTFAWAWHNYSDAISQYHEQLLRSLEYGAIAAAIALLISYPLAYWIALRGGRWKNLLLLFIIAPFFVTYLIRTLAWETILADEGFVAHALRSLGLLSDSGRLLASSTAVIAGITYNFLPFMTLPVYVALEKVDVRLIEAAKDLYAGPWRPGGGIVGAFVGGALSAVLGVVFGGPWAVFAVVGAVVGGAIGWLLVSESFVRVTLPLSLPGVFAGSLLTFIPAIGDYVNAELLGNPDTRMIGNVIQNKFLTQNDYPSASALSFALMAGVLIVVAIYARVLGTEELSTTGRV
jgi:spermidine/putrescine transport system permease protein